MKRSSLTFGFLLVSTALVHAQSAAETAWDAISRDINQSGLFSVKTGTVHHNPASDALTVENLVYELTYTLEPDDESSDDEATPAQDAAKSEQSETEAKDDKGLTISATIAVPTLSFKGLKLEDAGYSYDSIELEGTQTTILFDEEGTDKDARIIAKALGKDIVTKGYQPFFGEYKLAPSRPIGSTLDYIRPLLMNARYEAMTSEGLTIEQYAGDEEAPMQTTQMGPLSVNEVKDGKIGSYEISSQKSTMDVREPSSSAGQSASSIDLPKEISYEIGKTRYDGYDIGALWSVLDPNAQPIVGTRTLLEKTEMAGATINVPGLADISVGPSVQSEITVTQPSSYLVPLLDKMIKEDLDPTKLPSQEQHALIRAGFDLARSFAMGLTEIGKTTAQITIPDGAFKGQKADFGFESIRQAGFSSFGIEESSISGISYAGPPSMNFKLGRLAVESLEFADYPLIEKAIFDSMNGTPLQGSSAAKLGPNKLTLAMSGLEYSDDKGNALSADGASLNYDRMGLAIPAEISTSVDNLKIGKNLLQHPLATVLLDQLGLDGLTINEELTLVWDEANQTYKIEPINLELKDIASISGSIGAGGIMRGYLDAPETAQAAMATATILPSSLTLKDLGGLNELINLAGGAMGMGPEQIRSMATMQIKAALSSFTEPAFSDAVVAEVDSFLKDPQSLMVSLNPKAPVPLAQLLGVAATAPQQVPYLLAIGVIANEN
nr:hypothetical protein [uncultured Cohaesibacter sp.]